MFGAVSGALILEVARMQGYMHQLPLFETPPEFTVDPSCLCDIHVVVSYVDESGNSRGLQHTVEHPSVAAVRSLLHAQGYLVNHSGAINADTVVKPFVFNGELFDVDQRFVCAAALGVKHRVAEKYNKDW